MNEQNQPLQQEQPYVTINNVQQLFELNKNMTNFQSSFSVSSLSGEPFLGLVVDQSLLDSGSPLEFKLADKGVLSGDILQDNNIPNNWYLALKSEKPNKVVVNIQSVPVAPAQRPPPRQQQPQQPFPQQPFPQQQPQQPFPQQQPPKHQSFWQRNKLYIILGIAILAAVGYYVFTYYFKNKSTAFGNLNPTVEPIAPSAATENVLGSDLLQQINDLPAI